LAGHYDEALAAHNPFDHSAKGGCVRLGQMKESWIRREPKRLFAKLIVSSVHTVLVDPVQHGRQTCHGPAEAPECESKALQGFQYGFLEQSLPAQT
jgi:hypothetical protein